MRSLCQRVLFLVLAVSLPSLLGAQERVITGRVLSADGGAPLPDASVRVVGTVTGSFANTNGSFTINVPSGSTQLRISLLGWRTQDVQVTGGQAGPVIVLLLQDPLMLDEMVVTGTATTVSRRNLANAVATVNAEQLAKVPAATFERQLMGKIAGADIQANNGAPGGGMQINLRGVTSIIGQSTPLFVVDGVIVSNDEFDSGTNVITRASGRSFANGFSSSQDNAANRIADLNPADIETIEILKGSSAAAMYGSKASNGVILSTTKRGQAGDASFSVSQRFGTFDLSNKLDLRVCNTLDEAIDAFGPRAADFYEPGRAFDQEELLAGNNELSYETLVSVSGGNENTRYFASGLNKHDGGIIDGTFYNKQSLRLNLDQNLGDRAVLGLNVNTIRTNTGRGFTNNDNRSVSYWMTLPQTPTFIDIGRDENGDFRKNPFANSNPLQTAALATNDELVWRVIGSADLQIDLFSGSQHSFAFVGTAGSDFFTVKNRVFSPAELQFEPLDSKVGTTFQGNSSSRNLNTSTTLVHTYQPGSALRASTSFGFQYEDRELDVTRILNENLIVGQSNIDQGTNPGIFQNRQRTKDLGLFAQTELLLLDERVTLVGGVRADKSSNNADPSEFFWYPKAAAAYRFRNLIPGAIDELKLRGAWGQSGNQPQFGAKFSVLNSGNNQGLQTLNVSTVTVSEDLHPERQQEFEAGLDATLFSSRAQLEVTLYERRVTELLLNRALPPTTGFTTAIFNGGEIRTRGVESSLMVVPVSTGNFSWTSTTIFSLDRSKILDLPVPPFAAGGFGTALGGFRIENNESPTRIVGRDTVSVDNDPRCDGPCVVGDRIVTGIGDINPDFRMGFSNQFTFGGLSLYSLFDWQQGGDVINLTRWLFDLSKTAADFADPCVTGCVNDETLGEQRLRLYPGRTTKVWVEDATFVKLREVTLTYDFPQEFAQSIWGAVSSLRLNVSGRNLITWTDYTGLDPEVSNFGSQAIARNLDVAPFPPSRSFWLSLDVTF